MTLAIAFVVTSVFFLVADAIMLGFVISPLFRAALGDALVQGLRIGPAIAFYAVYMAGVMYFVSWPALRAGVPMQALMNGVILGLVAYGTYELTSMTVMRDWTWSMVATDMIWGGVVTGLSSYVGVLIALRYVA